MNYWTGTKTNRADGSKNADRFIQLLLVSFVGLSLASVANASSREQAKRIHDRLAGVPPTELVLQQMEM